NNYYKVGPAAKKGELQYRILALTQEFYDPKINPDTLGAGLFFIDGNVVEGFPDATSDNWKYGVQKATPEQKLKSKVSTPFPFEPITTQPAKEAYHLVLKQAGAIKPKRDVVDQRIVKEVKTGTCKYGGNWGAKSGIIDSQKSVGGWPVLKSVPAPKDSDCDGMPDRWEKRKGLNPLDAADRNVDRDNDGYTNLEEYLNELAR
ncbi:MAG TPA: pectate lyase, partial [Prolixibacteraceae bacterium]|nr:pectate lyase [Prolixibacteraceae bacterium]